MFKKMLKLPCTPPLSKKLLKLNVELLDAKYCINRWKWKIKLIY